MTSEAIATWEAKARRCLVDGVAAKAVNTLLEIGRRTDLLADNSKDVFTFSDVIATDDLVDRAKKNLRDLLNCAVTKASESDQSLSQHVPHEFTRARVRRFLAEGSRRPMNSTRQVDPSVQAAN